MQLHAITHSLSLELIECSAQDDLYGARLGSLLIRGPRFVPQDLNCSVGLPCVFGPLDGTALAPSDTVRLVRYGESCGDGVHDTLFPALDLNATLQVVVPALLGGAWTACWGDGDAPIGLLTVAGPALANATCTTGFDCRIEIFGEAVESALVAGIEESQTCGSATFAAALPGLPAALSDNVLTIAGADLPFGGRFILCSCARRTCPDNFASPLQDSDGNDCWSHLKN